MELRGKVDPEAPLVVVAVHQEAEHLGTDLPVLVTGVGKVAAATSVLEVVAPLPASARPKSLCNVGTAGALREGVAGTHVIGAAIQHDIDGESIERIVGTNPSPRLELGHGLTLATGDRFVADAATRDMLASRADLVDMEGYAVAFVARRLDLPVVLVKHVSDGADGEAVDSWIDSVARCSRQLGEHLRTTLLEPVRPVVTDQGG